MDAEDKATKLAEEAIDEVVAAHREEIEAIQYRADMLNAQLELQLAGTRLLYKIRAEA